MEMLVFLSGRHKGLRVSFEGDKLIMGREPDCDVMIDDVSASRRHCELERNADGVVILRDRKSTNGTMLNDKRVEESVITDGDKISVGETALLFQARREESWEDVSFHDDENSTTLLASSFRMDLAELRRRAEAEEPEKRTLAVLQRFNHEVTRALDLHTLLRRALEFMFEALPNADRGSVMLTGASGELENHAVRRKDGARPGPITISKSLAEMVLKKNEALLSTDVSGDARLGVEDTASGAKSVIICPLAVQDKRLGLIYIDATADSGFTEHDLQLLYVLAVQTAIAVEKVRLYGELMNAMEYHAGILQAMLAGIIVTDPEGVVTQVNPAALETVGMDEAEILGQKIRDIHRLRPIAALMEETRRVRKTYDRREVVLSGGEEELTIGLSTSLLTDIDGAVKGIIASFRDITIIKQLSEKVRTTGHLAALGEMAAGVAHEIRNPLNSIRGFAELLRDRAPDEEGQEWAGIIVEQVDRMDGIVQGLLDYSRQQNFQMEPTDIARVVKETLGECQARLDECSVEAKFQAESTLPKVMANANKLKQVFLNIALNAVDAMSGGGTLTVRIRERSGANGREVAVGFADTGPGIEPEHMDKIFDPFFTRKEIGTGLGLAICQRITNAHGGTIEVHTRPGHGAIFTVALPCRKNPPDTAVTP